MLNNEINAKGWGLGEINGVKGWFPGKFVKILEISEAEMLEKKEEETGRPLTPEVRTVKVTKSRPKKVSEESQFLIDMVNSQPWKKRLTNDGKKAYRDICKYFASSDLAFNFSDLEIVDVIGSGAFATVYQAHFNGQEVAVKKLMGEGGVAMIKNLIDFKTEASLLHRIKHKNIVGLLGATIDPISIVMEYCSRGNLMVLVTDPKVDVNWQRKRQIIIDLANGMQYLHEQTPMIIHRDLKSLNVLVDEAWVSKVTDFGLSRFKANTASEKMTGSTGTYHWMAPEVINNQYYNEKADVFSFAIIMWEVYTRKIPYNGMGPVQVVALVVNRRERPRIPSSCPQILAQLMEQCWKHDHRLRPSFNEIVKRLELLPE